LYRKATASTDDPDVEAESDADELFDDEDDESCVGVSVVTVFASRIPRRLVGVC